MICASIDRVVLTVFCLVLVQPLFGQSLKPALDIVEQAVLNDDIPGGSGAYDSLMVSKPNVAFPIDPEGPMRSGRLDRGKGNE